MILICDICYIVSGDSFAEYKSLFVINRLI